MSTVIFNSYDSFTQARINYGGLVPNQPHVYYWKQNLSGLSFSSYRNLLWFIFFIQHVMHESTGAK
jgi:hypothetical protein